MCGGVHRIAAKEASIIEKKGRAKRKKWSSDELLRPSHMPGDGVLVCMDTFEYSVYHYVIIDCMLLLIR